MGADWPLVQDALIIAALALGAGMGGMALLLRRRGAKRADSPETGTGQDAQDTLEQRVRVLERIATDRSVQLADDIEALREKEGAN